jgi:hypothetical protein
MLQTYWVTNEGRITGLSISIKQLFKDNISKSSVFFVRQQLQEFPLVRGIKNMNQPVGIIFYQDKEK